MALIIAGDRSGVGKTTITLAILAYLASGSSRVQSFKVGPDYIDSMFHSAVTGTPCRNLDPVLTSPKYVATCFQRHAQAAEWVVVEGVMGLFDGIYNPKQPQARPDYGSTAHIARILNIPVLLVLDCSSLSTSIAAIAQGYANLDPQVQIAGVVLNRVASDRHLELLTTALNSIQMPILGVVRRNSAITIPDRHLGLVPATELSSIKEIFTQLANLAHSSFNWEQLLPLLGSLVTKSSDHLTYPKLPSPQIRIAVARDQAFNFYYQDNLDILAELGAELVFWSPLQDAELPAPIHGLYFGGGFPEMFARQLAENKPVLAKLQKIIQAGIPTYAECGGLMYLCTELIDLDQQTWSMVGVIPAQVTMAARLTLGYRQAIALQSSCIVTQKQIVRGHEFHRSQLNTSAVSPQWRLQGFHQSSQPVIEGWNLKQLHASYLHLHWGEQPSLPQRLLQNCRNYKSSLY
ncbi:MAG: cobyrinate a,c-diamide synthase [Cyanobacteria bacterium J06621_8]